MSKSRVPLLVGLTAAGGVGYYLYGAGGDPKVARKEAEGKVINPSMIHARSIEQLNPIHAASSSNCQ